MEGYGVKNDIFCIPAAWRQQFFGFRDIVSEEIPNSEKIGFRTKGRAMLFGSKIWFVLQPDGLFLFPYSWKKELKRAAAEE